MLIGGGDPGATTGHGLAVCCSDRGLLWTGSEWPAGTKLDHFAIEGPWPHGPMGKIQMWALGFAAAEILFAAPADRKFILRPNEWRGVWNLNGKPKAVIVNRLRRDLKLSPASGATDDMVEAAGIAVALHRLLTTPGPKGKPWRPRKGCEVKR